MCAVPEAGRLEPQKTMPEAFISASGIALTTARSSWLGPTCSRSETQNQIRRLSGAPRRLDRPFLPDAVLARLRHREDGDQEHDRGNRDGIDQGPEEGIAGAGLHRPGVGECGDDGHETAAPAAADA